MPIKKEWPKELFPASELYIQTKTSCIIFIIAQDLDKAHIHRLFVRADGRREYVCFHIIGTEGRWR